MADTKQTAPHYSETRSCASVEMSRNTSTETDSHRCVIAWLLKSQLTRVDALRPIYRTRTGVIRALIDIGLAALEARDTT